MWQHSPIPPPHGDRLASRGAAACAAAAARARAHLAVDHVWN